MLFNFISCRELVQDPKAKGADKKLGDSLRANADNFLYKFNQEILKKKMNSGKYATIHVNKKL